MGFSVLLLVYFAVLYSCSSFYKSCLFIFQIVLGLSVSDCDGDGIYMGFLWMGGFTLMLHDVFVSMVMVMFFKRCFQTSFSHSCGYFQRFVSFSPDWIDGLWIGKAVRAPLAKIQ